MPLLDLTTLLRICQLVRPILGHSGHFIWDQSFSGDASKDTYYKHFVSLIKLLRTCLQFEISRDELSEIREGFQDWVKTYERYTFFKLGLQLLTLTFAMTYIVFITRSPVTVFQHALLPSTRCSRLLMGLKP